MYKLLIFDWDGTLIDSAGSIIYSMQVAARELGFEELEASAIRDIIGLALPEAIRVLVHGISDSDGKRLKDAYIQHHMSVDKIPTYLFPNVRETLVQFKEEGYRLAVATGKGRVGLDRVLVETDFVDFFEVTRCSDETRSKPDPLMLEEILWETGLEASDAIMIGDTEYDMEMAKLAGMDRLGVSYGVHDKNRLLAKQPLAILDKFTDLSAWLKQ